MLLSHISQLLNRLGVLAKQANNVSEVALSARLLPIYSVYVK